MKKLQGFTVSAFIWDNKILQSKWYDKRNTVDYYSFWALQIFVECLVSVRACACDAVWGSGYKFTLRRDWTWEDQSMQQPWYAALACMSRTLSINTSTINTRKTSFHFIPKLERLTLSIRNVQIMVFTWLNSSLWITVSAVNLQM